METIVRMTYGHAYWEKTIDFADACSWSAGPQLAELMRNNQFAENERVLVAVDGDAVVAFCTFSNKDEMPAEYDFTPFVGFMFVDEAYRGHRLSECLIEDACALAREQGFHKMHIMSGEKGLYEKYGFVKIGEYETIYGTRDQLFVKEI